MLLHGSTVATNAVLEHKFDGLGLLVTRGFRHMIEIARQSVPDGYFTISGRAKDLIISGGFNVYPAEVENALEALPSIGESAVIGLPHDDFGEAVTAVVTARNGASVDEAEVRAELEAVLAKFKIPKRVLVKDALPRNAMGKVQKNALRAELADLYKN